jgi:hypothetical protein
MKEEQPLNCNILSLKGEYIISYANEMSIKLSLLSFPGFAQQILGETSLFSGSP